MSKLINVQGENGKPIKFTHYLSDDRGWVEAGRQPHQSNTSDVYYLGNCKRNGDMFMDIDTCGNICIFKGQLNSGKLNS